MPGFVKTARDEKIWAKAKRRAMDSLGKKTLSGDDYALANFLYHKMKTAHPSGALPKRYDESVAKDFATKWGGKGAGEFYTSGDRDSTVKQATALRKGGVHATIWHMSGPKTGPKSVYAIAVPKGAKMKEDKKKCKCAQGTPCNCWAFAPFFGDGHGHSGATMPKDNVIPQDQHELPRGTPHEQPPGTNATDAPGGSGGDSGGGSGGGGAPMGSSTEVDDDPIAEMEDQMKFNKFDVQRVLRDLKLGSQAVVRVVNVLPGGDLKPGDVKAALKYAALSKIADRVLAKLGESRTNPLASLNEGLEFMNRVLAAPPKIVFPDDPDNDPNRNPMIMDDLDFGQMLYMDNGMNSPEVVDEDPLAPFQVSPPTDPNRGCGSYEDPDFARGVTDLNSAIDAMDDDDLDQPNGEDVLQAVLTILNAAMGF